MIYVHFSKDTRNRRNIILANGNGKTLVQNIRNKANKAARKILLGLNIFRFPSHFLSNLLTIMDMGDMDTIYSGNSE